MSLIDELREIKDLIPPSHVPSVGEVLNMAGVLIAYVEHGPELLKAAEDGPDAVNRLFAPEQAPDEPAPDAAAPSGPSDLSELEAENQRLRDQLAAAQGAANLTTASVEPVKPEEHPA